MDSGYFADQTGAAARASETSGLYMQLPEEFGNRGEEESTVLESSQHRNNNDLICLNEIVLEAIHWLL